jgi:urease alpha subunit
MLEAMASFPINFGDFGKGNSSDRESIIEQVLGGAIGMKIHENWSSSPSAIRTCLSVADEYDFQVQLHADTLNETGYYEDTLAAINGRVMHHTISKVRAEAMPPTSCASSESRISCQAQQIRPTHSRLTRTTK